MQTEALLAPGEEVLHRLRITGARPFRWIVVGQLLDAKNRRILKNAHLVYGRDHILHVGMEPPPSDLVGGQQTPDTALADCTALPGLIEGHSHVFLEGAELDVERRTAYLELDAETLFQHAERRIHTLARLGIAAMRDGGDHDGIGLRLSRQTALPCNPPYQAAVFSPGAAIHRKGRYGSFFGKPLEDFPDIASCVKARIAEGADHIKIVPTGIINFAQGAVTAKPQFSAEEIRQLKQAARAHGKHLMAHASGEEGIANAIDGGVDTLEHGFFITGEQLAKMRDKGIAWLPTLTPVQEQVDHSAAMGWDSSTLDHLKRILENHAASIQKALAMGVNVLVGSDAGSCGVAHGIGLLREMELLETAGMPTLDILCQATYGNHRALTTAHPLGSLETGFKPRFLVSRHAPLETVANLQRERWVVFDGEAESSAEVWLDQL